MKDRRLLVGLVDQQRSFEQFVDLVAGVTGAAVRRVPGESQSVVGTLPTGYIRVLLDPADMEPLANCPYLVDLELEDPAQELELMDQVFTALVAAGYRVVLLVDSRPIRSSHSIEADTERGRGRPTDRR